MSMFGVKVELSEDGNTCLRLILGLYPNRNAELINLRGLFLTGVAAVGDKLNLFSSF